MYFLKKLFERYFDTSYATKSEVTKSNINTTDVVKATSKTDIKKTE